MAEPLPSLWVAEREAHQALMALFDQAERCKMLFWRANLALPEALIRLFGEVEPPAVPALPAPQEQDQ
jgi:hypothetical protein